MRFHKGVGMIRRFGEAVAAGRNYSARPGVYAILLRRGDVLLTHQAQPVPEFQLPGGGIDPGEQPLAALHREVFEETGWSISAPRRLGAFRRFTYMPEYDLWAEKVCVVYLARPVRALGAPSEAHHMAVWTPLSAAPEIIPNQGDRHFLRQVATARTAEFV